MPLIVPTYILLVLLCSSASSCAIFNVQPALCEGQQQWFRLHCCVKPTKLHNSDMAEFVLYLPCSNTSSILILNSLEMRAQKSIC